MTLDIPTLAVTTTLLFLLLGVAILAMPAPLRGRPELVDWTRATWLMFTGLFVLSFRPLPASVAPAVTGTALLAGTAFYSQALWRFVVGRPWRRAAWVLVAIAILAFDATGGLALGWRQALFSLLVAAIVLPPVLASLPRLRAAEPALALVAAMMGAMALVHLLRAVLAFGDPQAYDRVLQGGVGQSVVFLAALLAGAGSGFGFVLAMLQRETGRIEELARVDPMTGALSRSAVEAVLEQAIALGRRRGEPVALVMMDLDYFKQVNDRWGHRAGDEVLRQFARTVRESVRASDVLGRMGGEEFCLVLPATAADGATRVAGQVRAAVAAMQVPANAGGTIRVTVSCGVSVCLPDSACTPDELYTRADRALYAAKAGGRDRVELAAAPAR